MRIGKAVIPAFIMLFFGLAMTANAALNPAEKPVTQEVSIVRAEFGLFSTTGSGEQEFVPSRTAPLVENQGYGWIILLDTNKPKIRWREEFTLPAAPAIWGGAEPQGTQSISSDKRVSIIEREDEPDHGMISNSWAVAPGDPKGHYVIRVIIENRLEKVFEFDVQ